MSDHRETFLSTYKSETDLEIHQILLNSLKDSLENIVAWLTWFQPDYRSFYRDEE